MGFTALDRIGSMLGWQLDPDPMPDAPIELTYGEFDRAVRMLEEVGFPMERTAEEAWPDFHGWRVNYETTAYRLADRLVVPPAPWSGRRHQIGPGIVEPRRPPHRRPAGGAQAYVTSALDPEQEQAADPRTGRPGTPAGPGPATESSEPAPG
jgi:hypothetical protein